jgi:hypothetical protein
MVRGSVPLLRWNESHHTSWFPRPGLFGSGTSCTFTRFLLPAFSSSTANGGGGSSKEDDAEDNDRDGDKDEGSAGLSRALLLDRIRLLVGSAAGDGSGGNAEDDADGNDKGDSKDEAVP